jgi:hypothetical protein
MSGFRRAAVQLALAAMMLRALLPAGWMPNPAGFSESAFVICTMDMPASADVGQAGMSKMDMSGMDMPDMKGAPSKAPDSSHSQQECPFAAAPHVAAPLALAQLSLPITVKQLAGPPAALLSAVRAAHYQPQSPRAPPQPV